ncbi:hypothetical protein ACT3UT_02015 [Bacillus spizizenii ATCC 6633 = JCM 2499]|uniref:Uncharacterized protein n=2 Tax=Bacillus spizizenii TaxID=96241 RepID=A0A9Q4DP04_BACSC|nr:hypothetical protein [Bacillus spizizenii]KFI03241.1 hypothetical protein JN25_10095 [Bacillus sp. BSC154]MDU7576832.1 hypothetical protein [Bacillus subtilis]ADM36264.1 hypothetical protein BSUW23_01035 [Bacillus spizizenii str. W23]EFG91541.1 hypothetical protein BSU6633_13687 [Bacillus spizizenii ATCC 6633 = JCM 2499]MBE0174528.1 hypothetical protein [Bacillus spizizenii]
MISICLKKSLKRSSTSQAARVIAIADTGITAATAAQVKEDTTTVMAAVIAISAGATAAVNLKKSSCSVLGQGFFYVTD